MWAAAVLKQTKMLPRPAAFTVGGVRDWRNIKKKMIKHTESAQHEQRVEKWQGYQQSKQSGPVIAQVSTAHMKTVKENREYATSIAKIVLFLAK